MRVEIDRRFAEIAGAEAGALYKKYVEGIAVGAAPTPDDGGIGVVSERPGFRLDDRTSTVFDGGLVALMNDLAHGGWTPRAAAVSAGSIHSIPGEKA